jgi:excisionase family DNA binding protein
LVHEAANGRRRDLHAPEVADNLKLTERTLYRLTREGRLPEFKVGKSWRFRIRDIEAWIEAQQAETQRNGEKR